MSWKQLGRLAPTALEDARLELHHAAQLVSALGYSLLEPRPDDSHPNLGWLEEAAALVGHRVPPSRPSGTPLRAGLCLAELALLLLDESGRLRARFPLAGHSLAEGLRWLEGAFRDAGGELHEGGLCAPTYELPEHPVAHGAPFAGKHDEAFAELADFYANANALFCRLAEGSEEASEVRCWPHHFDLATLLTVAQDAEGVATRTIGIGFSPGDASYTEPYFYVTPWPYPDAEAELPPLPAPAHWHREGFTAAILSGSALLSGGTSESQEERAQGFLDAAVAASRKIHAD